MCEPGSGARAQVEGKARRGGRAVSAAPGLAWAALGLLVAWVAAADPPERAIDESHRGYVYFREYCAACHGVFADGLGPVSMALRTPPADLTRLAARYGRPLPKPALIERIDGRNMVGAHGRMDMPVWGTRLHDTIPPNPSRETARRQTILLIVEYLDAIQAPPADP